MRPEEVRYVWRGGALLQWSPYHTRQEAEAAADESQRVIGSDVSDDLSRFFYLIKQER